MKKTLLAELAEDKKRFKLISEYQFYVPRNTDLNEDDEEMDGEEFPEPPTPESHNDEVEPEAGGEEAPMPEPEMGDEEAPMPEPEMDAQPSEPEGEINAPDAEIEAEPAGDEVELDVTDIVQKSDEAKAASDEANSKIDMLMSKLGELEQKLPDVGMLGKKIEDLQKDIEERNPTPTEKLEMRSMDSFPYNLKLTDYWENADQDVDNGEGQEIAPEEEELVLTKDDVKSDYSESSIKNSFDYKEEDL
jgi:hypothetical protein